VEKSIGTHARTSEIRTVKEFSVTFFFTLFPLIFLIILVGMHSTDKTIITKDKYSSYLQTYAVAAF